MDNQPITPEPIGTPAAGLIGTPPMSQEGVTDPLSIPTPKEEENPSFLDYVLPANFSEEEEEELKKIETRELGRIKQEYAEIAWFDRCEKNDDEYEGAHDDEDDDYIRLLLGTLTIDIIASREFRQTWSPNQFATLEGEFEDKNLSEILSKRMDFLDYIARKKSGHMDISLPNARAAGKYGVSIVKTYLEHIEETQTKIVVYRPGNQEDIQKFAKQYKKKLADPESKEFSEFQSLMQKEGKPIAKKESKDNLVYHGTKMYRVDPKKFFARPSIKDFRKHTMISEMFKYNWYEIENYVNSGIWIEKAVEEIKTSNGETFAEKDYDFYTSIVQFDRKGNGKMERYLITREAVTKKMVRAIYYPYKNICYHAFWVFEKDDSWIGYSMLEKMEDLIALANTTVNSFVAEQDLAHTPLIASSGRKVGDWSIKLGVPNILQVDPAAGSNSTALAQYRMESPSTDRISFLQWLTQYCTMLTGVDPALLTGMGMPNDKRAAKEKVSMAFQASSIRIEDMIITLQKGHSSVAAEEEDISYRFPLDPSKTSMDFFGKSGNKETIDSQFFEREVRYAITGSTMSFDPQRDLQMMLQTVDFLSKFAPEIAQNIEAKKAILTAMFNNSKGTVEKMADVLLAPINQLLKLQKSNEEAKQKEIQDFVAQKKAEGWADEQIQGFLREQAAQKQQKPPQPQQPPQGVLPPNTQHHVHHMAPQGMPGVRQ